MLEIIELSAVPLTPRDIKLFEMFNNFKVNQKEFVSRDVINMFSSYENMYLLLITIGIDKIEKLCAIEPVVTCKRIGETKVVELAKGIAYLTPVLNLDTNKIQIATSSNALSNLSSLVEAAALDKVINQMKAEAILANPQITK